MWGTAKWRGQKVPVLSRSLDDVHMVYLGKLGRALMLMPRMFLVTKVRHRAWKTSHLEHG